MASLLYCLEGSSTELEMSFLGEEGRARVSEFSASGPWQSSTDWFFFSVIEIQHAIYVLNLKLGKV